MSSARPTGALVAVILVLAASAAGAQSETPRPGAARVRTFIYHDNSGLDVTTAALEAEQDLAGRWAVNGQLLIDRISLERKAFDPGDPNAASQLTGHVDTGHLDAVTSASATISGGGTETKTRYEGIAGVTYRTAGSVPASLGLVARVSSEVDYFSVGGQLRGAVELFERRTTLTGFVGGNRDRVTPLKVPPGQDASWPATSRAVKVGALLTQVISARVVGYLGLTASFQSGKLGNPYRRAIVVTTLFPEVVPDTRKRYTAYAGLSLSLFPTTAIHLVQGVYRDSWGVEASIPEVAVAQQLGSRVTAALRYRYYAQSAADFYQSHYHDLAALMSGDFRLGEIHDHSVGASLEVTCLRRSRADLVLHMSYDIAHTTYSDIRSDVTAHIAGLAIEARF